MTFTVWVAAEVFGTAITRELADLSFRWAALEGVPSMTITKEK